MYNKICGHITTQVGVINLLRSKSKTNLDMSGPLFYTRLAQSPILQLLILSETWNKLKTSWVSQHKHENYSHVDKFFGRRKREGKIHPVSGVYFLTFTPERTHVGPTHEEVYS